MYRLIKLIPVIILAAAALPGAAQIRMCLEKTAARPVQPGVESYVFEQDEKWDNGAIINVKFRNGTEFLQSKVIKYARVWEEYANIHFNFDGASQPAILIEFSNDQASWSYMGRQAKAWAARNIPTMHYGWFSEQTDEADFRRTILHEFGHALGLGHEHQSSNNTIKWNKPAAYNYYFKENGWLPEQVDKQVFNRFSVSLSNGTYDRASIMHYPIPDEITLDGHGVPWNTELSTGDISIISEKYPKIKIPGGGTGTPAINAPVAIINKVTTTHNVTRDGQKGILVTAAFDIDHARDKECLAGLYFFTADNQPVAGLEPTYRTSGGSAGVTESFTPPHLSTGYPEFELFIPYRQLAVGDGESKLKFLFVLHDGGNEIARSAYTSFTLRRGPICRKIDLTTQHSQQQLYIIPKFTVENAQHLQCWAKVYFCNSNGDFLKWDDGSIVAYSTNFNPGYETAAYNSGYYSDLHLNVPYKDLLPFINGTTEIKYFVRLLHNDKQFAESDWGTMTLTRQ